MKKYKVILSNGQTLIIKGFYIDEACRNHGLTKEDLKGSTIVEQVN